MIVIETRYPKNNESSMSKTGYVILQRRNDPQQQNINSRWGKYKSSSANILNRRK
jgi:hypothetical protein